MALSAIDVAPGSAEWEPDLRAPIARRLRLPVQHAWLFERLAGSAA